MNTSSSILRDHPFLRNLNRAELDRLEEHAVERSFEPGEVIFKEGEPANRFYLIQYGRVALETKTSAHATVVLQVLGAGEALGWSWLFPPFTWHFQARALEPTRATVLDGAHLLVLCNEDHEFGYTLMQRVTQVVIARLQAARRKLLESVNGER